MAQEIKLNIENNSKTKLKSESFIKKLNDNTLTADEAIWGAETITSMVESLYTPEELKKFKDANISPEMGIMVDGKPVVWEVPGANRLSPDMRAKIKCGIVAKALQGAKIDLIKYKLDEKGNLEPENAVAVVTEEKIDKKSWFRRLLEAIGIGSSASKKIKAANKAPRNLEQYTKDSKPETDTEIADNERYKQEVKAAQKQNSAEISIKAPEKPNTLSIAKRQALTMQMTASKEAGFDRTQKFDAEFFGDIYSKNGKTPSATVIDRAISKDFRLTYTKEKHNENSALSLNTIDRQSSRSSFAILYGMTKGHSLDEMIAPENADLRRRIGREFVEDMKSQSLEDFAASKGLDKDDAEARRQYQDYFIERRENIEKFYARSYDALRYEDIVVPDPNNLSDFVKKGDRIRLLGTLATDLKQSFEHTSKGTFDKTNEADAATTKRFNLLTDNMMARLNIFSQLGGTMRKYQDFLASSDYANFGSSTLNENARTDLVNNAAQAKAAFMYMKESTQGMNTFDDLIKNTEVGARLVQYSSFQNNTSLDTAENAYNHFLCNDDPTAAPTVIIPEKSDRIINLGKEESKATQVKNLAAEHISHIEKATQALEEYKPMLARPEDWDITFANAYEGVINDERKARGIEVPTRPKEPTVKPAEKEHIIFDQKQIEHEKTVDMFMAKGLTRKQAEEIINPSKEQISFIDLLDNPDKKVTKAPPKKEAPSKQKGMGL